MDKSRYTKAYREAVKQLDDEKTAQVKALVKETLERIASQEKARQDAVSALQLLKKDLDDLREGRIDRIAERHEKDKTADARSPITPQRIEVIINHIHTQAPILAGATGNASPNPTWMGGSFTTTGVGIPMTSFLSVAAAAGGTYLLDDGTVKML